MAAKNVGTLIREARTAKKLSQEQLAGNVDGLSGNDVGKAERGEKELTQNQLKAIAKALGITQKSLLEAPKGGASATASKTTSSSKTTSAAKTGTAKKTSSKASTAKSGTAAKKTTSTTAKTSAAAKKTATTAAKTSSTAAKKTTAAGKATKTSQLSSTEQKLIELYRAASSDDKKLATRILKGENLEIGDLLMLANSGNGEDGLIGSLLAKMQGLVK